MALHSHLIGDTVAFGIESNDYRRFLRARSEWVLQKVDEILRVRDEINEWQEIEITTQAYLLFSDGIRIDHRRALPACTREHAI